MHISAVNIFYILLYAPAEVKGSGNDEKAIADKWTYSVTVKLTGVTAE